MRNIEDPQKNTGTLVIQSVLSAEKKEKNESVNPLLPDSEILFGSELFTDYYKQLKIFILFNRNTKQLLNNLSKESITYQLIVHIFNFNPGSAAQNREFYQTMISLLRNLAQHEMRTLSCSESKFINQLCHWIFHSASLENQLAERVRERLLLEKDIPEVITPSELIQLLKRAYLQTKRDQSLTGTDKSIELGSDFLFHGNIPFVFFESSHNDEQKQTSFLRMPNVVRNRIPGIIPSSPVDYMFSEIFYRYLHVIKESGQKHLYVNLHNSARNHIIHEVEKNPTLEGSFFAVSLDKNSSFYWQGGKYEDLDVFEKFKEEFLSMLFASSEKSTFYWPISLERDEWKKDVQKILETVHHKYFDGAAILSQQERQNFIEITYLMIIKALIQLLEVENVNISCAHTIDRGPTQLANHFLNDRFSANGTITREDAYRVIALIVELPIVLHNRPAHEDRIERLIGAISSMYTYHE